MELIVIHITAAAAMMLGDLLAIVRSRWFQGRAPSAPLLVVPAPQPQRRVSRPGGLRASDATRR